MVWRIHVWGILWGRSWYDVYTRVRIIVEYICVMTLFYDNLSAINISKNHVQHSRTKNFNICHDFTRGSVERKALT